MDQRFSINKKDKALSEDRIKLLDYIQDMSNEMSNLAKAAEMHDLANVLQEVETVAKAAC